MNPGIYGLSGTSVTPVQGPFSGIADARKLLSVTALIVGGGGGGNTRSGGTPAGGGGGGGVLEQSLGISLQTAYTITIGAGGAANIQGSFSQFGSIVAIGGGAGVGGASGGIASGASGGGGAFTNTGVRTVSLCSTQGFSGGLPSANIAAGGGGGAAAQGGDGVSGTASGNGGAGRLVSLTNSYYGGGGGGGCYSNGVSPNAIAGTGGIGGGGNGNAAASVAAVAGTANTGGGGGGGGGTNANPATGGSGVVIIRWNASQAVATLSSGLTATRTTVGTDSVLTITAGTGTVTWS